MVHTHWENETEGLYDDDGGAEVSVAAIDDEAVEKLAEPVLARSLRSLDRSEKRDPQHEVRPPLLSHGEEGGVSRLVGVEVVDDNSNKELETNVDSEKDEDVKKNCHVLLGGSYDVDYTCMYMYMYIHVHAHCTYMHGNTCV